MCGSASRSQCPSHSRHIGIAPIQVLHNNNQTPLLCVAVPAGLSIQATVAMSGSRLLKVLHNSNQNPLVVCGSASRSQCPSQCHHVGIAPIQVLHNNNNNNQTPLLCVAVPAGLTIQATVTMSGSRLLKVLHNNNQPPLVVCGSASTSRSQCPSHSHHVGIAPIESSS